MRSICICGSKRYKKEIREFAQRLEKAGVVVFRPNIELATLETETIGTPHQTKMVFKGLTLEHFDWIRKADVCFIYNKNHYIGVSVSLEMGFANALGKPIYALEESTGDPCSDSLIDAVTSKPEELIKKLN